MRDGWVETTLDRVTECSWGNTETTKSKYVESGYLAYSASGADGFLDWFEHDRTAVVLSAIGAQCGKTWFAEGKWTSIKNTIWLKSDNSNLLDKYLFYLSNTDQFWQIRGQAQPFISLGDVKKTKVLLPPLPEQKRIVDLISSVDSYVEALEQQLESAKRSRNAVLHELLTAGSDDWVEKTLGEITDLVRGPFGGSLKKEIFVKEGFAVYEQQHAIYGDFSTIRYRISSEKFDEMKRFTLEPGDLIMSCSGTMGKVRIVPKEADPGIINQALLKIKPKSNLSSAFLYLWMQSNDFIRQIEMNSGGGALQNVSSVKMLKGIKLRVPGLLEQERIIGIIAMIDEVIIKTELAICEAKNLRSGLLSDLLSGKHEIPASYDKVMGAA